MRLIDADWVLGHLKSYEPSDEEWSVTGGTALRLIHNAVDNAPTVDAEVVSRCKDCNYSTLPSEITQRYGKPGTLTCHNMYAPSNRRNVGSNDFCSYGEPKDGTHA